MPQVKGTATWLANPRQESTNERVRLDYSSEHIENERIKQETKREVDGISNQRHRALADRAYLIKEARDAVRKYSHMQMLMKNNEVDTFLKKRRADFKKQVEEDESAADAKPKQLADKDRSKTAVGGTNFKTRPNTSPGWKRRPASTKYTSLRPKTAHADGTPEFSYTDVKDGDFNHFKEAFLRTADPKWKLIPLPVSNGSRRAKRPKTSCKPRSRVEIRNSLMAEFNAKNAQGRTRPMTSLGLSRVPATDDWDDLQPPRAIQTSDEAEETVPLRPKQVTTLRDAEKAMMRAEIRHVRERQMAQQHVQLQRKVKDFYEVVEDLRLRTVGERIDSVSSQRKPVYTFYK